MEELKQVVKQLDEKQAEDIKIIDVKNVNPMVDYFVICTGKNERHMKSLAVEMRKLGLDNHRFKRIEGENSGVWVLADLGNIVVHVFTEEGRNLYSLEQLWGDLTFIDVETLI